MLPANRRGRRKESATVERSGSFRYRTAAADAVPSRLLSIRPMVNATWPPVLRNLQSAWVLQPSLVTTRSMSPVRVRTESIWTRRKIPMARRFRSDSAMEAES